MAAVLEEYGYEVFLPQRDGIEAAQLEGKTEEELIRMISGCMIKIFKNDDGDQLIREIREYLSENEL